ncbi:MAG: hypothetical protein PGN15_00290 [Aeromicrobium erythreum]
MCGIVGLHLRNPDLYPRLGELLSGMLCEMEDRGADSAGVAVYGDPTWAPPGTATVSVLAGGIDVTALAEELTAAVGSDVDVTTAGRRCSCTRRSTPPRSPRRCARRRRTRWSSVSARTSPCSRASAVRATSPRPSACRPAQGWQGVGHTRMATEVAVTPAGSHPYAVGPDQCMVHNGSFHNYPTIRRELEARGVRFDSGNDTEVGARFVAQCLEDGLDVETALKELCRTFDGFYTLLVSKPRLLRRRARRHRLQAGRGRRDRRLGGDGVGVPRRSWDCPASSRPACSSRSRSGSTHGPADRDAHPRPPTRRTPPWPPRSSSTSPSAPSARSTPACTTPTSVPTTSSSRTRRVGTASRSG